MIGEMNRRITIKSWLSTKDAGGGVSAVEAGSYSIWAKVEDRSGIQVTSQNQMQWNYDYKITFRYEVSRPVSSNQTIVYDGKSLTIKSTSFKDEGNRKFVIARCSVTTK